MTLKIMDAGGVLRTVSSLKIKDGSILRNILRIKVMDADGVTLRTVATFASELSPTISASQSSTLIDFGPPAVYAVQYDATASPGGGLGPYSYSWAIVSGSGWSIIGAGTATAQIAGSSDSITAGTARVTITDSAGQTATADLALLV